MASCQIPVLPYLLLIVMVLLINPICKLIRVIRVFSTVELLTVFLMCSVSAGIANYGLVEQVVPIAGGLFYGDWNNPQSAWNRHITPFVKEAYFVSEPGIQKAARKYHASFETLLADRTVYDAANRVRNTDVRASELADSISRVEADTSLSEKRRKLRVSQLRSDLEFVRQMNADARQAWSELAAAGACPEIDEVLRLYPERIAQGVARMDADQADLTALESKAFEKVALFRRGLPRGMSALPGIMPMREDNAGAYFARLRRLVDGMGALRSVKAAMQKLEGLPPDTAPDMTLRAELDGLLQNACEILAPIGDSARFEDLRDLLRKEKTLLDSQRTQRIQELGPLRVGILDAGKQAQDDHLDRASALESEIKRLERQQNANSVNQERNNAQLTCAINAQALIRDLKGIGSDLSGGAMTARELHGRLARLIPVFAGIDVSVRRYFVGEIPWQHWLRPLVRWGILIGLTYLVFMSLNLLIFRQWAHNEMLTYPLAELPKALIGDVDSAALIPAIYRNNLFWIGVAIAGGVMGWNLLCASQIVPGLVPIEMHNSWGPYVYNTKFASLGSTRSHIFFVMIGLAFLIPKNISFSLWFFHVLFLVQILLISWAGYKTSYTYNWWYLMNFRLAEGQGALMVFSIFILYKCRQYILCAFMPSTVSQLESGERRELKLASWAFLGGSLAIILQLWLDMGANLFHTVFFYIAIILLTVGMVRAVTEGGLLAVKTHVSPFHVVRAFIGLDQKYSVVSLFTPLILYCGMMYLDLKVFIAPTMANAVKLREDYRLKRVSFHIIMVLAILMAAVAATVAVFIMAYSRGADNMTQWFYTSFPRWAMFHTIRNMMTDAPAASPEGQLWLGVGALGMALLIFLRRYVFWMPHPLGLAMYVNPIMNLYWFSILIGWIANVMITKYGNKEAYQRVRGLFVGLIVGELLIVILAVIVSVVSGVVIPIDLNRM